MTFEEYLQEHFMRTNMVTDDLLPDMFADWISEVDVETILELAEKWHKKETDKIDTPVTDSKPSTLDEVNQFSADLKKMFGKKPKTEAEVLRQFIDWHIGKVMKEVNKIAVGEGEAMDLTAKAMKIAQLEQGRKSFYASIFQYLYLESKEDK